MHLKKLSLAFLTGLLALGNIVAAPEIMVESRRDANPFDPWATLTNGESPAARDATIFGNVALGTFREERFRMTNTGDQTLVIAGTSRVGGSQFQFVSLASSLAPGATDEFRVRFTPTDFGDVTPFVRIDSNDPSDAQFNYALSATGTGSNMSVRGGTNFAFVIEDGDTSPRTADRTDFGPAINADGVDVITVTFQTQNIGGTDTLNLGSGSITPAGSPFSISSVNNVSNGGADNFTVTFSPETAGTFNATVNITTDDQRAGRDVYNFAIRATATGTPNIQVDGRGNASFDEIADGGNNAFENFNATDFGRVDIGTPDTRRYRIENEGNDTLSVSSITSSNSQFFVNSEIKEIPGGTNAREEFTITFTPTAAGFQTSLITINSNDPDSENPYTFRVRGEGEGEPNITLEGFRPNNPVDPFATIDNGESPPQRVSTDFGNVALGTMSGGNLFRIRNRGGAALTVTDFKISDPDQFIVSRLLATPFTLGTTNSTDDEDFNIQFRPASFGEHVATVTVTSNDPDTPTFTFEVGGTGSGSNMSVRGGTNFANVIQDGDTTPRIADGTDFGNTLNADGVDTIEKTFQIRNVGGTETLNIDGGSIFPADAPFTIASVNNVSNGGSDLFTVTFAPDTAGTYDAEVRIVTDDARPNRGVYSFAIRATATGTPNIQVDGRGNGSFDEIPDAGTETENFNATDFGNVDLNTPNTRRYRITNEGNDTLDINSITSSNEEEFVVTSAISSLPGGVDADEEFTITFTPVRTGRRTSTITINSNDPDQEGTYTFLVAGTGNGPEIEVYGGQDLDILIEDGDSTPSSEELTLFDPVPVNSGSNSRTFVIRNPGNERLNIRNASNGTGFTGEGADSFSLSGLTTNNVFPEILPGGEDRFQIIFDPTRIGNISATLNIVTNTSGSTETYSFIVAGVGSDPNSAADIVIFGGNGFDRSIESGDTSPRSEDGTAFGEIASGEAAAFRSFELKNISPEDVLVIEGGIQLDPPSGSGFTVSSSPSSTVGVSSSAFFSIRLDPNAGAGSKSATVRIVTNDPDTPVYTFAISGTVTGSASTEDPEIGITQDGDDLVFTIDPAGGATYRIASSTDLDKWEALPGQTGLSGGEVRLSNVIGQGGGVVRFYRLEEE